MNEPRPLIVLGSGVNNTSEEEIRQSPLFIQWLKRIANSREIVLTKVTVAAVYKLGKAQEIKIIQLEANACSSDGRNLDGIAVTLRSDTVDVLHIVTCQGRDYVLHVSQLRVPAGQRVVSNVAGMVDAGETKESAGRREGKEEIGMDLPPGKMIRLNDVLRHEHPYLTSSGTTNEQVDMFAHICEVSPSTLKELQGRYGGLQEENEQTQVSVVVPFEEAFGNLEAYGSASAKSVLSLTLYLLYKLKMADDSRQEVLHSVLAACTPLD